MKFNKIWQNLEFRLQNFLQPQTFGRQFIRVEIYAGLETTTSQSLVTSHLG